MYPSWWSSRTTFEKSLLLLSILLGVLVIGLIIGLIVAIVAANNTEGNAVKPDGQDRAADICLTKDCISSSVDIFTKLNPNVNPCDDFYEFACGTFTEETVIPDDKTGVTIFSLIADKLQLQLREIVSQDLLAIDDKFRKLPNLLYQACMDTYTIEQLDKSPIVDIVEEIGGWPVIRKEKWNQDTEWSWETQIKELHSKGLGTGYIFSFGVDEDMEDTTKRILDFDQASLGLSRAYLEKGLENSKQVKAYLDYMIDIAVLFGADREFAKTELTASLGFEIELAKIFVKPEDRRNPKDTYNIHTLKDLQTKYSFFNWLDYVNALLPKEVQVTEDEKVNVAVPSYFEKLGALLAKTEKRVIANYIMWRVHAGAVSVLPEQFRNRQLQFAKDLFGTEAREPRWSECTTTATNNLPIAVGSLYVREHFKNESKDIAMNMVNNVRSIFNSILNEIDWMDAKTREAAQKKLEAMATYIGYPDEMLDNKLLNEYYSDIEIDPTKYLEAMLLMSIAGNKRYFMELRKPIVKTEWTRHAYPAIVNAFYSPTENSIQFPAGILQGHFFNAQRPQYLNYGAIGWVIGHEITHGFDDQGSQYDLHGNLRDWWEPSTKKLYLEKAQCIIDQYAGYVDKLTGEHLNGINTQGENIADNGGIKESYRAYQKWVENNGAEKRLPGLEEYSPQQLFWIAGAQTWCNKYRTESLRLQILTGVHSPGHFRVLGPFKNSKDFAKDFNCPVNSPMNPKKKCEVW